MASFDGLDRMNAMLSALGNPEADFKAIHIAGTNGKGSTAVMTASILEEAGFTVGLYTSPHLENECERVQIWDGTHHMIGQNRFDELKDKGVFVDEIDALSLAVQAGNAKSVNIVLMGRLAKYFDIDYDKWVEAIKVSVKPQFVEVNLKAFDLGYHY